MPETAVKILFERYGPKYRAFVTFTVVLGITYFIAMVPATLLRIPKSKAVSPGRAGGETRAVGNVLGQAAEGPAKGPKIVLFRLILSRNNC